MLRSLQWASSFNLLAISLPSPHAILPCLYHLDIICCPPEKHLIQPFSSLALSESLRHYLPNLTLEPCSRVSDCIDLMWDLGTVFGF